MGPGGQKISFSGNIGRHIGIAFSSNFIIETLLITELASSAILSSVTLLVFFSLFYFWLFIL